MLSDSQMIERLMESMHMLGPYCFRNDPRKKHFCILKGKKKEQKGKPNFAQSHTK